MPEVGSALPRSSGREGRTEMLRRRDRVPEHKQMEQIRGQCYDHNFLAIFTIVRRKIGTLLENQCYFHPFLPIYIAVN
jgi:hypothetical protein